MTYTVIYAGSISDIIDKVNAEIRLGWKPIGGISASAVEYEYENMREGDTETHRHEIWAQAMVSTIAPE